MRGTWQTTGGGGGGGLVLAVIAAAVLIGSGAASAIASALATIVFVAGCILGAAVLGGIAWLVYRARQGQPVTVRQVHGLTGEPRPRLEPSSRPALEPGREVHLHFHIADPADAAAIIRQALPGTAGDAITEGK